jgi:putative transposase
MANYIQLFIGLKEREFVTQYRRAKIAGGTYFIIQVTYGRSPWLCDDLPRQVLRRGIEAVRKDYPFAIDGFVLLPDHFHLLMTLPEGDANFSERMRRIKGFVTRKIGHLPQFQTDPNLSREKRGEKYVWQRRFWEHCIRDEQDFKNHLQYIHNNPVKHQYCKNPEDWKYSSIHRYQNQ